MTYDRFFVVTVGLALLLGSGVQAAGVPVADVNAQAQGEAASTPLSSPKLAEHMAMEPVDSTWAREAEKRIEEHLRLGAEDRAVPVPEQVETQCRSTMCRVRLAFGADLNQEQILRAATVLMPWDGQRLVQFDQDQENTVIVFIPREGARLPGY